MSRNQRAQNLVDEWIPWLRTKTFYGRPYPKHILAMLSMPDTSREPPDAKLSAELAAFHLGVVGLDDHIGRPFLRVYADWPDKPIKLLAYEEGIGRDTYYERAHKGASIAIHRMNGALSMIELLAIRL